MGGTLGIVQGIPQVVRIVRLGHGEGLSWASRLMMLSSSMAWMSYGIRVESPSIIVTNLICLLLEVLVVFMLAGVSLSSVASSVAILGASLAVPLALPLAVVSVVMFAFTTSRVPQIVTSYRSRREGLQQSAVSMGSLATSIVSLLCWMTFSVLSHRYLLIGTTSMAMSITLGVTYLERTTPRAASPQVPALATAAAE